jgi:protease-4
MGYVDSIAQGRVWTGAYGLSIGLVDRIGTMQDAMDCAVRMAGLKDDYRIKEYPERKSLLDQLSNNYKHSVKKDLLKNEIGEEQMIMLKQYRQIKQMIGEPQAKLPFAFDVR